MSRQISREPLLLDVTTRYSHKHHVKFQKTKTSSPHTYTIRRQHGAVTEMSNSYSLDFKNQSIVQTQYYESCRRKNIITKNIRQ